MAKRYFADHGYEYVDLDVSKDRAALRDMVSATGQYGVPVIMIGEQPMVGWDKNEFERLMGSAS